MSDGERSRAPGELPVPEGLGNRFAMSGASSGGMLTVEYGVFREQLPLGGRPVAELRRIVGPRFDIDRRAIVIVDGNPVDDETVVQAGQEVRFMHFSGQKGQLFFQELLSEAADALHTGSGHRRLGLRKSAPRITIEGGLVETTTPEGRTATMPLEDLLAQLDRSGPGGQDFSNIMMPDGVKWVSSRAGYTVLVHQTPPGVHNLKWIAPDSKARHGKGTTYRQVRIALPYVIVFAVFETHADGKPLISDANECFFRTLPLCSPDDDLNYPALLNCSKFGLATRPLSWICTQHLVRTELPADAGINDRVRNGLGDLMRCLFSAGFNYSSEDHELSSWFTESTHVDPRVSTIERWEEATRKDPMFVSEIPWLEVDRSVRSVADRILTLCAGPGDRPRTSSDVSRVLRTHGEVRTNAKKNVRTEDSKKERGSGA